MGSASLKREPKKTKTFFLWLFSGCLFFSLLAHLFFYIKSQSWKVMGFSAASYDTIVPRTFRMKRVEIDPKLLEETEPKLEQKRIPQPVVLNQEKPTIDNRRTPMVTAHQLSKPSSSGLDLLVATSTPQGEPTGKEGVIVLPKANDTEITLQEPEGLQGMKVPTQSKEGANQQVLQTGRETPHPGELHGTNVGEFSNLEQLLAGNESVSSQTAPILMPTDLLFEYDADTLKPAATESLTKLGALIKKNGQATFRIEGHTDSFGSDEYNKGLSLRRAEAVKTWLQQQMGIEQSRITTAGLGKNRLLVPAMASIQEQQLNRRVEIVISTK
jgi:outer membrane protein OmpA-like peptidoglycan-associated protein